MPRTRAHHLRMRRERRLGWLGWLGWLGCIRTAAEASAPTGPAGLWFGTLDASRTLSLLVLPDGSYQLAYSKPGAPSSVGGIAQGAWTAANGVFSSAAGRDFNFEGLGASSTAVAGSYAARSSFTGAIAYPVGRSSAFSAAYAASSTDSPSLAAIAGVYSGQFVSASGLQDAAMSISTSGRISALNGSCELSGTASARADANAYKISRCRSARRARLSLGRSSRARLTSTRPPSGSSC